MKTARLRKAKSLTKKAQGHLMNRMPPAWGFLPPPSAQPVHPIRPQVEPGGIFRFLIWGGRRKVRFERLRNA
jgi:hypothetical protein